MKWSWKIAKIAGIDVYLHATFLILLGWTALASYLRAHTALAALSGVVFTITIFTVVVLHEFGHALTARRFGIKTIDITLLPIGGVARLERMPERPRHEFLVALAGPCVNVVLAALLFAALRATGQKITPATDLEANAPFLLRLFWVNVVLAGFNLLPAFPMDGGRALRALLAMRTSYVRATLTASWLGQALALVMGLLGLFFNPFLLFIALFVWIGAAAESSAVVAKALLAGLPVRAAMLTRFTTLEPTDTISTAVKQLLAGSDIDFPIVENGRVVGVLTRNDLLRELAKGGPAVHVGAVMQANVETVDPSEPLDKAVSRLDASSCRVLPVVRNGELVGLLTPENVTELLMVESAISPEGGEVRRLRSVVE